MAFDHELRGYLERLARDAQGAQEQAPRRRIDPEALRRHFLERLRGLEGSASELHVQAQFDAWSPKLPQLVRYLEALPREAAPTDAGGALAFARRVLDRAMRCDDPAMSVVDRLELDRIYAGFDESDGAALYALETRLAREDGQGKARPSGVGRVFLRLRGKDAVRWLLTAEVAQSRGAADPWRAPRELLERAVSAAGITMQSDEDGEPYFPFHAASLARLVRLDVLDARAHGPYEVFCYRAAEAMRDVVRGVLDAGPWHAAMAALLEDERAEALQVPAPRAADAAIEQTRLIAHEVRNALIPVRHDVDALLKANGAEPRARLERSRRGVVRVLEFVDEMVATSELVREPPAAVEIGDVIREALGWHDGAERVEVALAAVPLQVHAPRSRLVRAVSNVLENALQATGGGGRVRITARRGEGAEGAVQVAVDDSGPGVPEERRESVFRDGYTTRPGGSGFGLAYVRRVVEDELHGRVWCERCDLGGARFVMAIPESKGAR